MAKRVRIIMEGEITIEPELIPALRQRLEETARSFGIHHSLWDAAYAARQDELAQQRENPDDPFKQPTLILQSSTGGHRTRRKGVSE